jgi:hypothetical protein
LSPGPHIELLNIWELIVTIFTSIAQSLKRLLNSVTFSIKRMTFFTEKRGKNGWGFAALRAAPQNPNPTPFFVIN